MIPVLMFHSVGNTHSEWHYRYLSTSKTQFENFCRYLLRENIVTVNLKEWHEFKISGAVNNKDKFCVLTFDDGYLDNLIHVYPILIKYNIKATIFINPEFVDPSEKIRLDVSNAEQDWNSVNHSDTLGFLNWKEIIFLDNTKYIDIQSHSMSHNFYFNSNKLIDVYTGQEEYQWLAWMLNPAEKPFYLSKKELSIPYGFPIFEYGRALGLRRYMPDDELIQEAIKIYHKQEKNILNNINTLLTIYPGRFESNEEMDNRYRYELFESKRILEEKLKKNIDFLCWPGGGYNEKSIEISLEAGYKASTIRKNDCSLINDLFPYICIPRIGMGSFLTIEKKHYYIDHKSFLVHNYKGRTGNILYRNLNRIRKIKLYLKKFLRKVNEI